MWNNARALGMPDRNSRSSNPTLLIRWLNRNSRAVFFLWVVCWLFQLFLSPLFAETATGNDRAPKNPSHTVTTLDLNRLDPFYKFAWINLEGSSFFIQNNKDRVKPSPTFLLVSFWNPNWFKSFLWRAEFEYTPSLFQQDIKSYLHQFSLGLFPTIHKTIVGGLGFFTSIGGGSRLNVLKIKDIPQYDDLVFGWYLKGIAGIEYSLTEVPILLLLEGSASVHLDSERPFTSLNVAAGIGYQFVDPAIKAMRMKKIQINDIRLFHIFTALNSKYKDVPIGKVHIKNVSTQPLTQLTTHFYIQRYMDQPKEGVRYPSLGPGEVMELDLHAIFNQEVLGITEDTVLLAQITVSYSDRGEEKVYTTSKEVQLYNRNAMTWSDTQKLGSFITLNDEPVRAFARNMITLFDNKKNPTVDRVEEAMEIYTGLHYYGIRYVSDPNTPFNVFSMNVEEVDRVNYPRETLMYKSGDCDDLVILYCSLLENVGIPTAFVTIPGHIFMMFDTGVSESDFKKISKDIEAVYFLNHTTWIPVEVTAIPTVPFSTAWEWGVDQLKRWQGTDGLEIVLTNHAQANYPAVSLLPTDFRVPLPNKDVIASSINDEISILQSRSEVRGINELIQQLQASPSDLGLLLKIGQTYLENHQPKQALNYFKQAQKYHQDHVEILVQLGRTYLFLEDWEKAEETFSRCTDLYPEEVRAYMGLSVIYEKGW